MKLIGASLFEAKKANERAEFTKLYCNLEGECPLLKNGICIHAGVVVGLGGFVGSCVYGKIGLSQSPTKRSKTYYDFIKKTKKEMESIPRTPDWAGPIRDTLAEIGDYVYLPYSHANMCKEAPFLSHSHLFSSGSHFIKKELFTAEVVVKLAKFRPMAMMGGEITQYQKESVPVFLFHLQKIMPKVYQEAAKLDPIIEQKTFNIAKLKQVECSIGDVPANETNEVFVGEYEVSSWDGEILELKSETKRPLFMYGTDFVLKYKPDKKMTKAVVKNAALIVQIVSEKPWLISKAK